MKKIFTILIFLLFVKKIYSISPSLLKKRFNEVCFIQSHNATSNKPSIVQDQDRSIEQQLADGIRSMKIPVHYDYGNFLGYYYDVLMWYKQQLEQHLRRDFLIKDKQDEIKKLQREINKAPWYRKFDIGIRNGAKITKIGIEITDIENRKIPVSLNKEIVEGALKFLEAASSSESRKRSLHACHGLSKGKLYKDYIKDFFEQAPSEIKPALKLVEDPLNDALKKSTEVLIGKPEEKGGLFPYSPCFLDTGKMRLIDVLNKIYTFLIKNSQEVFCLKIEEYTYQDFSNIIKVVQESGLDKLAHVQDINKPWPTIEEMITSGKRFVLFSTTNVQKEYPWVLYYWDFDPWHAEYNFTDVNQFLNLDTNKLKQEFEKLDFKDTGNKVLTIHHAITKGAAGDKAIATKVNAYNVLYPRAKKLQEITGHIPNFISIDFYEYPNFDVFKVQNALNGIAA